ncbi:acyl dehydratase [Actinomadura sp. KC345]|uniref:acyl dehydratase n=1 Tax=Actinomadura sp. KC345 TaxID=2530371 RepID=UPI001A9DA059|nr:acyl dehydratase [Actinomadura sp. KC345]
MTTTGMTTPGESCPSRSYSHSTLQLFRFSAVSWNSHRIHYDEPYARSEGHPGAVVQSTLHGEMLARHALDWAGPGARLEGVSWRNQGTAVAGEPLTWKAVVRSAVPGGGGLRLSLDASIVKADGTPCVTGTVDVLRPP